MRHIFTADLHLTSRPSDNYRWTIFEWLNRQIQNREIDRLFILGDLTDRKDDHPSVLVNRLAKELVTLSKLCPITITKGNHDYTEETLPYFDFLNSFKAPIEFITEPQVRKIGDLRFLLVPHQKSFRKIASKYKFKEYDRILLHQCVRGAKQPSGFELEGVPAHRYFVWGDAKLPETTRVLAGDIHMPQTVNAVTYCGSPHPIDFGDDFKCRVLFDKEGVVKSIPRSTFRKVTLRIEDPEDIYQHDLLEGDWVRLTMVLPRSEFHLWDDVKKNLVGRAEAMGLVLFGPELVGKEEKRKGIAGLGSRVTKDYAQVIEDFGKARGLDPEVIQFGKTLL